MSIRLQQVKALLQGIRADDALYDSLRELLQRQRICMIRRASEELLAVNEEITHHYEQLHGHSHQRHSLLKMRCWFASKFSRYVPPTRCFQRFRC